MTEAIIFGGNDNYHLDAAIANAANGTETEFTQAMDKYGVILMMSETSESELNDLSSDLPTDTHLVRYINPEGDLHGDAVRAYKKSDIFDCYHDSGLRVLDIQSGFGSVKPKLFQDAKKAS